MINIIFKLFLSIVLFCSLQIFAQVESTTSGGPWTSPSTWKDNVVPAPGDNVLIKGPVTVDFITFAQSIQITNTGGLAPEVITSTTYKLYVANYIWNNGTINGHNFEIIVGGTQAGSIYNLANGTWNSGTLRVVDTLSHAFLSEGIWFRPSSFRADSATLVSAGNIQIDSTSIYARQIILGQNLQNEKMTLDHGSVLHVENFINLVSDTSGLEFKNNSYISSSPISGTSVSFTDVIFKGDVGIGTNVFFYGSTILKGNMLPQFFTNYKITSSGLFQNNGEIKPAQGSSGWKLLFDIWGDLFSNGNWDSNVIRMMGSGNHIVLTDPNFTFSPSNFSALTSTVTVATFPLSMNGSSGSSFLRFDNSTVRIMKIVLETGSSLNLVSNSSLAVNELIGNGNVVKFISNSYLSYYSGFPLALYQNVNFTGEVGIGANVTFIGDCYLNGNMYPQFFANYTITSNGLFRNNGEIKPAPGSSGWKLFFDINGDLTSNGPWNSSIIKLLGNAIHNLEIDTSYSFAPSNFQSDSSTVLSSSDLRFDNSNVRIKSLTLQNSNSITFNNSLFSGSIHGNSNNIYMNNNSYFSFRSEVGATAIYDSYFYGNVGIGTNILFNGNCYLNGNMYPQHFANYTITSSGLFQNNGEIKPAPGSSGWKLFFDINGDLTSNGPWNSSIIKLLGNAIHNLEIDTSYSFAPSNFQSDSSTVLSSSDLRFDNSNVRIKSLTLQNSNSITFNNSLFSGSIHGNSNNIYMNSNSYFSFRSEVGATAIYDSYFYGNVGIGTNILFNGNCYLNGNMYPQHFANYTITSSGLFQNNGEIKPAPGSSGWKLFFDIQDDIENTGYWNAQETRIIGDFNQHLGIQDTAFINKIKIDANRNGDSYQWMLNGNPITNGGDISGATSSIITINNFDSKYFGTINCEIDSAGNSITSRDIIVNDIITEVEIDNGGNGDGGKDGNKNQIPKIFSLSQNYPNPFNPTTIIEYDIPAVQTGYIPSVQLRIFDILGREVAVLVNEQQKPGYYKINFDASRLSSGIYFYRISAGKFVSVKKMILLK